MLAIGFAMGPVCVETDNSGVDGEDEIVVVSSTFRHPLRFSLRGGGFVWKFLGAPVGEVPKLHVNQVILGVQAWGVSAMDDVALGAFWHIVCPELHRRVKNMRSLCPDSGTEWVELTYQPEEQLIRLPYGGVGKVLEDREQSEVMGSSQVPQCYSVSVGLLVQLKEGSSE